MGNIELRGAATTTAPLDVHRIAYLIGYRIGWAICGYPKPKR